MKKIIRLSESDLARIVKRVIREQGPTPNPINYAKIAQNTLQGGQNKVREDKIQKWLDKFNQAYRGGGWPPVKLEFKDSTKKYLKVEESCPYYPSDLLTNSCYANPKTAKGWYNGKETNWIQYVEVKFTDECIPAYQDVLRKTGRFFHEEGDTVFDAVWPSEYTPENVERAKKEAQLEKLKQELGQ